MVRSMKTSSLFKSGGIDAHGASPVGVGIRRLHLSGSPNSDAMIRTGSGDDQEERNGRSKKTVRYEERMREREKSGGENRKEMNGVEQFLEGGCLQCKRPAAFLREPLTLATKVWPSSQASENLRDSEFRRLA